MAAKIKKGDYVVVLSGNDKGRKGEVLKVLPTEERVVVKGVRLVKRHVKPSQADPEGGIKSFEAPIHVSNVAHIDPKDNVATRVGFKDVERRQKGPRGQKIGRSHRWLSRIHPVWLPCIRTKFVLRCKSSLDTQTPCKFRGRKDRL